MIEVIMLGIALSMDALAVSIANGIKYSNYGKKEMFLSSLSFGVFQGMMPLLGYLVFSPFITYVSAIDHWLVMAILGYLGFNMIKDSFEKEEVDKSVELFSFKILMAESVATAIDALSVGIALPTLPLNPYLSCLIICMCTFIICLAGHGLGKKLGMLLKDKALAFGGVILILIGLKTLVEHLGLF